MTQPAEHCGYRPPSVFGRATECVLRPGHSGSHADETGMRWWRTGVAEAQPAGRIPLDELTSDAYDQLYAERDRLRAELDRTYRHHDSSDALQYALGGLAHHCARAEKAEAALERVREFAALLDHLGNITASAPDRSLYRCIATDLRAALDPQEPQP